MDSRDLTIDVIILMQTVVGILGNFSLLCHYIILYITGYRLRSTDLIIKHLIVANFLTLLCKGVPHTMAAFGWKHFPSDFGCKVLFFLHRVGRGVSIGSICLLSVVQVIMVSPRNSSKLSNQNITKEKDFGYCASIHRDKISDVLLGGMLLFPDVLCLGLIIWASGSMVFILHRHKQQVQHIRRTKAFPRSSPESRATKTILLLSWKGVSSGTTCPLSVLSHDEQPQEIQFTVTHCFSQVTTTSFFLLTLP
nr:vomeronasal type-1 receptor 4-like [Camelus dromedarius]